MSKRISEKQKRKHKQVITRFIEQNPGTTRPAIMAGRKSLAALNKQMITVYLRELREEGLIVKTGGRKTAAYHQASPTEAPPTQAPPTQAPPMVAKENKRDTSSFSYWGGQVSKAMENIDELINLLQAHLKMTDGRLTQLQTQVKGFLDGQLTVGDLTQALEASKVKITQGRRSTK